MGLCWGGGGRAGFVLNLDTDREEFLKARIPRRRLRRGDVLRVIGGGWGNPSERDRDAVQRDREEGFVTEQVGQDTR